LPRVCMKCGAPATVRKSKLFIMLPRYIGHVWMHVPIANFIVAAILTKRQRVETTLCDQHKNYWWLYPFPMGMLVLGILGFNVLAWLGASVAVQNAEEPKLVRVYS